MGQFAAYDLAITSVAVYALTAQILNAATGIRKGASQLAPGASHDADYDNPDYRLDRTYMNTVESLVFYAAIVFAAVLAGASPMWTNILASAGLALRVTANLVYMRGIGAAYGGVRTQIIVVASLCNTALVILTLVAVFGWGA